jgi:phospholipase/lecithinase/hemolysin
VATLTVLTPPKITQQPSNQTASLFADATFHVQASGDAPLSYQWRFDNTDLIGMTNSALTLTTVQRTNAGPYRVVVANASGVVTSQVATLSITPFNSIYCFGFSWTDTHNCTWDPAKYWHNHACNGPMWPEYLSTNLGLAYIAAHNYAHCGATTSDILNQAINFPAPLLPQLSLYCLWTVPLPGNTDADLLRALTNQVAGDQLLQTEVGSYSNAVNRLYLKGARTVLVEIGGDASPNPPQLLKDYDDPVLQAKLGEYIGRYHAGLYQAFDLLSRSRPDLRILSYENATKMEDVLAHVSEYGFTVWSVDALDDPALTDKSFTGPGADYFFWDANHGTSKLHKLVTNWHLEALAKPIEELEAKMVGQAFTLQMNHLQIGRDYTLQKSPDLKAWSDVQTFTASAGTNQWSSALGNDPAAYFRLTWEP